MWYEPALKDDAVSQKPTSGEMSQWSSFWALLKVPFFLLTPTLDPLLHTAFCF